MANTTAQLILEAGTREPTQRLGFGLRLGNAPESPAPTTVTYRYPVICDCVLFSTGTQSMNLITMLSKFTYGYLHLFSGLYVNDCTAACACLHNPQTRRYATTENEVRSLTRSRRTRQPGGDKEICFVVASGSSRSRANGGIRKEKSVTRLVPL